MGDQGMSPERVLQAAQLRLRQFLQRFVLRQFFARDLESFGDRVLLLFLGGLGRLLPLHCWTVGVGAGLPKKLVVAGR